MPLKEPPGGLPPSNHGDHHARLYFRKAEPCQSCQHFTGRVTGEFGACLRAEQDSIRAPFDTCKQHTPLEK
jgi:hypothetical protein